MRCRHRVGATIVSAILASTLGTVIAVAPAAAKTPVGTGTVACNNNASGSITYTPAFSDTGQGKVKAAIAVTFMNCSGGSPAPSSVTVSGKLKFPNGENECTEATNALPTGKLKLTYGGLAKPSKTTATVFFVAQSGVLGWAGNVSGSYAATNQVNIGPAILMGGTVVGNCTSGITSIQITGGSAGAL